MTPDGLVSFLKNVAGEHTVKLVAVTDAKVRKRECPFRDVKIIHNVDGRIGFNYETEVIEGRKREDYGDKDAKLFVAGGRSWGQRLEGSPLVFYNGKYYLPVIVELDRKHYTAVGGTVSLTEEQVTPYLRKQRDTDSDDQGLMDAVRPKDFKIESILSVQINDGPILIVD